MMPQPRKPKTTTPKAAVMTDYVILRQADVREEPVDENVVTETAWLPETELVGEKDGPKHYRLRVVPAINKAKAIEAVTGPDGPDIVEGAWKAVALTSWKGGQVTRRVMKSDRLPLDETLA